MARRSSLATVLLCLVALVAAGLFGLGGARAGETSVPLPQIPTAKGECVAPKDVMRRTHMTMLKHTRDVTVRDGDRRTEKGLSACVSCHAVGDGAGGFVTVSSPKHFCRACHDYAAVRVDCFECHASRPTAGKGADAGDTGSPVPADALAALKAHAEEITR